MSNTPTPCNECGKTHPWLSCVTPATAMGLNTPTELPEDIKVQIEQEGINYSNTKEAAFSQRSVNAYIAGATAYAPHKVEAERAKKLLERWINVHDLGILPSEQLINEINQFLQSNK